MSALRWLVDFIFPPRCPVCMAHTDLVELCVACLEQIAPARSPLCPRCGESFPGVGPDHLCTRCTRRAPHFDRARACSLYGDDAASPLIAALHRLKYDRDVTLAPILGRYLQAHCPLPLDHDVLVPVPLDLARLRWRGFNQALLLGRALASASGVPVAARAVRRARVTPPQVGLGEPARRRNVAGAFTVAERAAVIGRRVLLVDDVMTTGATVDECAKVLRRAGAKSVDVVVLARAAAAR